MVVITPFLLLLPHVKISAVKKPRYYAEIQLSFECVASTSCVVALNIRSTLFLGEQRVKMQLVTLVSFVSQSTLFSDQLN